MASSSFYENDGLGVWCIGHGVDGQAKSLEHGHYVPRELVNECFSNNNGEASRAKGFSPTLQSRCRACQSIRNWHHHHENAIRRARRFRREHANRWLKHNRTRSIDAALTEMDIGGLTDEALAGKLLAALGEDCPGLCAHEEDGRLVFHTIDSIQDMQLDVRDPSAPFSLENIGVLCSSCNQAKRDTPWHQFIYRRRAALRAWKLAIDFPSYRKAYQTRLF